MDNKQFVAIIEESDLPSHHKSFCLKHLEIHYELLQSFQAKAQMYQINAELYDKNSEQIYKDRVLLNGMITKYSDRFTQQELSDLKGVSNVQ